MVNVVKKIFNYPVFTNVGLKPIFDMSLGLSLFSAARSLGRVKISRRAALNRVTFARRFQTSAKKLDSAKNTFISKGEALAWLNQLPEKTALYYLNLIKDLHDRPAEGTNFENVLEARKKELEENLKREKDKLDHLLRTKTDAWQNEQKNLSLTIQQQKAKITELDKAVAAHWATIQILQQQSRAGSDQILSSVKEIQAKLHDQYGTAASSVAKGALGESWVFQLLADDPNLTLTKVGKQWRKGDIEVSFLNSDIKIMLEVKNHDSESNIPLRDRNKFYEDLESNKKYSGGILVSVHGGFEADIKEFHPYLTQKERKPHYFISNLAFKKSPDVILKNFLYVVKMLAEYRPESDVPDSKMIEMTQLASSELQFLADSARKLAKSSAAAKKVWMDLDEQEKTAQAQLKNFKSKMDYLMNGMREDGQVLNNVPKVEK